MNVYELEKQATQGPFGYRYDSAAQARADHPGTDGGGSSGFIYAGESSWPLGRDWIAVMAINRDPKKDKQREADTALLAHCRNNFMKALEALKEEHDGHATLIGYHSGAVHYKEDCETCKLIKELETIT